MSIVIDSLSKSYGDLVLYNNYSVTFNSGENYLLNAPSGKGKTTLIRLILGLEKPTSGSIRSDSSSYGVVFQEDRLIDSISAVENVRIVHPDLSEEVIISELKSLLPDADLTVPVNDYSGGMRRRVAIVRAFIGDYDVYIADEPLTGLDGNIADVAMNYILSKTKGKMLIVASHNPAWEWVCNIVKS